MEEKSVSRSFPFGPSVFWILRFVFGLSVNVRSLRDPHPISVVVRGLKAHDKGINGRIASDNASPRDDSPPGDIRSVEVEMSSGKLEECGGSQFSHPIS